MEDGARDRRVYCKDSEEWDPGPNAESGVGNDEMPVIPQTLKERELGDKAFEKAIRSDARAWEGISRDKATSWMQKGYSIASRFIHWQGVDGFGKKKRRFVQNLTDLTHW